MNKHILTLSFLLLLLPFFTEAQKVTFSPVQNDEDVNMNFDILGKVDSNYLIYKNMRRRQMLTLYDRNMKVVSTDRMRFLPEKTISVDFIMYPKFFYAVYQFEKSNVVYCYAVKLNNSCQPVSDPVKLDSTRIGVIGNNKIYSVISSEDKQKILVYKMQLRSGKLSIGSVLLDGGLNFLDSNRTSFPYSEREEYYSDLYLANDGTVYFARNKRSSRNDNFHALELCARNPGDADYSAVNIPLDGNFIDEAFLKVDNMNRSLLITAFYYSANRGNILGLFTAIHKTSGDVRHAFNAIDDSVRNRISNTGRPREAFDNLFIRNMYVRRNGSFVLTAEDYTTQRQIDNYAWNRSDYLYNSPYMGPNDVFFSPYNYYYPGYYRGYRPYGGTQSIRYFYDDLLVLSMDSALSLKWQTIIEKRQVDNDNENYLSFGNMSFGGELHFFFIEDNRKNDVVSNQSILPDGRTRRYGAIKSREFAYSFMPRLGRQTGAREMIVPCSFRGNITFALVDFSQ